MNRANDLFLLLLNLAQLHDQGKVTRLFLESLGELFGAPAFELAGTEPAGGGASFRIATRHKVFGHLVWGLPDPPSVEDRGLLHNAAQLLAVILERLTFEEQLEKERSGAGMLADQRLVELTAAMDQLRLSRNASLNLVEDLTRENAARQRAEAALAKRMVALTRPLDDPEGIAFEDLFNLEDIQLLQDQFAEATGVASIITRTDGTPITRPSKFCRLCSDIIRKTGKGRLNCYRSDAALGKINPDGPIVQPCLSGGLWDAGAGISVGGKHIANWLIGQVRDETQSDERMRAYAREIGADEEAFIAAFHEVPAMTRESFGNVAWALHTLAGQLSESAYRNVQQARFIHDRRRAEEALRESEERFRAIIAVSNTGAWEYHRQSDYLWCSPEYFTMLGRNPDEFVMDGRANLQETWLDLLHPDDREPAGRHFAEYLQNGSLGMYENYFRMRHTDGSWVWIWSRGRTLRNPDGRLTDKTVGTHINVTERKQAEDALRESDAFLRMTQKVARLGGWMTNIVSDDLIWNDGVYDIIEESRDYHPGLSEGLKYYCPEYLPTLKEGLTKCLATGEPFSLEAEIITAKGNRQWVELRGLMKADREKQPMVIGTIQDITSRKQAEEEKAKLQTQLAQAQKMESVGRLAGGVAHDFNNMLQAILSHASLAMQNLPADSPLRESLSEIEICAMRSADLTRQLLAFARKQTVAPKVLDLNTTAEGLLKMLRRLIGENIDLIWNPGRDLWQVKLDPSQVDQILANLCVNARDAVADVGKITIETGNTVIDEEYCAHHAGFVPGEYVLLAVSDDGSGMDAETIAHIFEPFFTTKEVGKGTGLGLATVYGAVKQNGGFIDVYSEPRKGTTIKIYFPRYKAGTIEVPGENWRQFVRRGTETILLVEDEEIILKLGHRILVGLGYTVLVANNPNEAIRLVKEYTGHIHLLITDVVMPQMNGRELFQRICSLKPSIKCLYMSGYTANVIVHHGILQEETHFIQKPFAVDSLAEKVREALESRYSSETIDK